MAGIELEWWGSRLIKVVLISFLLMASLFVSAKGSLEQETSSYDEKEEVEADYITKVLNFLWQPSRLGYTHVWPVSPTSIVLQCLYLFVGLHVLLY